MNRAAAVASLLLLSSAAAAADPSPAETAAICGARTSCTIVKSHDAGNSATRMPLRVIEVRLGLADKPEEPPEGCRNDGKLDGGVEYWLIEGAAAPHRVLKLCNDGYGASGVGKDRVEVGANRLTHEQIGGSAWRWVDTIAYSLSPWRARAEQVCSYHNVNEQTGVTLDLDFVARTARSLAKDSTKKDLSLGCPDWPKPKQAFTPQPAADAYGAYNVVLPGAEDVLKVPAGIAIGNCVPAMTTAGANGFVVYGKPSAAGQIAEMKAIAASYKELVIQVFDPLAVGQPDRGTSWIHLPHVEIWTGLNDEQVRTRLGLDRMRQIGVDLAGHVYDGAGKKGPAPKVERWTAKDEARRPVVVLRLTWAEDHALRNGLALVYSQAEAGRQARLVATTGIAAGRPLYVPDIARFNRPDDRLASGCLVRDGRLVAQ